MKKLIFAIGLILFVTTSLLAQTIDPLLPKQWALENKGQIILKNISDLERVQIKGIPGMDINWVDTKEIPSSKKEIVVAVLDSGLDLEHPDLKGRIWFNEKLCAGATNTTNRSCYGHNYLDNNTILTDELGHGTHVAGLIAANRNNIGIAGAGDPRVKIMALKVLNNQVNGFVYNGKVITDVIADAMIFAIKNGAEVINLSLGWPKLIDLPKVRKAFEMAEENNVVVVAASGNNNKDLPTFPCSYENVICVGAIDNRGELTDFTNHGAKVDIVAPGESIISTYPRNLESRVLRVKNYESKKGSSQAAPYVAAAIANLKLLHPGLTNNQVRSLIFRSSRPLNGDKDLTQKRFVKFGLLNMKSMLELASKKEEEAFITPEIKAVTEIKYKASERTFSFKLNLKNLSSLDYSGLVCLSTQSKALLLDQGCLSIEKIKGMSSLEIPVTGILMDLKHDSHLLLQLQIDKKIYSTSLVFSRDLSDDSALVSHPIKEGRFEEMAIISGDRRLSRMMRVFDKHRNIGFPEYFFLEKLKQTETSTVVSLLTKEDNFLIKTISLPKVNRVLSIHRQDINQDGKLDYFIYTLSDKKDELIFYVFDEKLKPLFGNLSTWSMTLTTFEGLPIEGGVEKFEWIKIKNPDLGQILVPSIYRTYFMPELDNSKLISDRVIGASPHQYFLNPVKKGQKVSLELRVTDNSTLMKALREKLGIRGNYDSKSVYLLKPFPQTAKEALEGTIRSLIVVEDEGVSSFAEIAFKSVGNNIADFQSLNSYKAIDQSLIYPVYDLKSGEITSESIFTGLLNRSTAEFMVKSGQNIDSLLLMQEDWENPIIGLLGSFDQMGEKSFLIESRSSLSILRSSGEKSSLPIYRDSSFPGQSFSETLTPLMVKGAPGVYVNSTLIYGERIYSMIASPEGLLRPLGLSVSIPNGCVPLLPETLESKQDYQYVFLCTDSQKTVSLKFLPM